MPLFSLVLSRIGFSASVVGLNTSTSIGAALVVAPLVPWLLKRSTPAAVMLSGILLSTVSLLCAGGLAGSALSQSMWPWFLLRAVIGGGISLHWAASETCINEFSSDGNRGFVAGIYSALFGLGLAVGPAVLQVTGTKTEVPFVIAATLVLCAALPLFWVRRPLISDRSKTTGARVGEILLRAPVTMMVALFFGFIDSATFALLPIYGIEKGVSQAEAVTMLMAVALGAIALQMPIGILADKINRRGSLFLCACASTCAVVAVPLLVKMPWLNLVALFVWGGLVAAFYTLALTIVGSKFHGAALQKASALLIAAYCVGGIVGAPVTGAVMERVGANGFVITMAGVSLVLSVSIVLRLRSVNF